MSGPHPEHDQAVFAVIANYLTAQASFADTETLSAPYLAGILEQLAYRLRELAAAAALGSLISWLDAHDAGRPAGRTGRVEAAELHMDVHDQVWSELARRATQPCAAVTA